MHRHNYDIDIMTYSKLIVLDNMDSSPPLGSSASQEFDVCLCSFCGESWRFAETLIRRRKMTKYCGDLRRRRIRTITAQTNIKILALESAYVEWYAGWASGILFPVFCVWH